MSFTRIHGSADSKHASGWERQPGTHCANAVRNAQLLGRAIGTGLHVLYAVWQDELNDAMASLLRNDVFFALLGKAERGDYQAVVAGIQCSTFSVARFKPNGAPVVRRHGLEQRRVQHRAQSRPPRPKRPQTRDSNIRRPSPRRTMFGWLWPTNTTLTTSVPNMEPIQGDILR